MRRAAAVAVIACLAIVAIVVSSSRSPETYPWGDTATTSIYTLRASQGELQTGAYSRFFWNHPGPLLYQLLAPLYRLTGYREVSIKWTALLINLAAIAAMLAVVARRRPSLAVAVAIAIVPLVYREQRLLFWAWNPIITTLPLALAIALAADIGAGRLGVLPVLVFVGSFIVQAHVGFVPVLGVIVVVTGVLLLTNLRRGAMTLNSADVWRNVGLSAVVFVAAWAVPLVHEIRTRPGNLATIARFFIDRADDPQPWHSTLAVFVNQLAGAFDRRWELTTAEASEVASWPIVAFAAVILIGLVATIWRAWRRRDAFQSSVATLCFSSALVGIVAIRSIVGPISDYLVLWIPLIGALSIATITSELVVGRQSRATPLRWQAGFAVYLAALAFLGGARLISKQAADARSTIVPMFTRYIDGYAQTHRIAKPVLRFSKPGWEVAVGVVLDFYKHGKPIAVADDGVYLVGETFRAEPRVDGEFYLMMQDDSALPAGTARHEWIATAAGFRLVRLFRAP
ncbi:MAG TPA: hypothetical protein VJP86_08230 [Vicinamibacterales bacterium]|nr:hypothetical protein [Vicinamibacterales bacterium]